MYVANTLYNCSYPQVKHTVSCPMPAVVTYVACSIWILKMTSSSISCIRSVSWHKCIYLTRGNQFCDCASVYQMNFVFCMTELKEFLPQIKQCLVCTNKLEQCVKHDIIIRSSSSTSNLQSFSHITVRALCTYIQLGIVCTYTCMYIYICIT